MVERETGSARAKVKGLNQIEREEKRKRAILWSLIGVIIAALATVGIVAAVKSQQGKNAANADHNRTPKYITKEGSFQLLQNGSINQSSTPAKSNGVRAQVVFDPMCPGCGAFDRSMHSNLMGKVSSGSINLFLSPVTFLDPKSTDQYSSRAASAFVTVAEEDPAHAYAFMTALYDEKNQPKEGSYKPVSDQQLAKIAESVGVKPSAANDFAKHYYVKWVQNRTMTLNSRKDLFPQGLSTPGVFLGGKNVGDHTEGVTRVDFTQGSTFQEPFDQLLARLKK